MDISAQLATSALSRKFWGDATYACAPFCGRLGFLPSWCRQAPMVSNFRGCCSRVILCRHPWVGPDLTGHMVPGSWGPSSDGAITGLGLSSEEQWLVQGLVPLLGSLLPGLNLVQPAFLDAVLAPGPTRHDGASAGPAKAQLLCLPVVFPCLNPLLLPAVWELVPGLFVSSPALGPFLWGDADSLLGRLRDLWFGLPGRFGLCLLWRRREVYGVLESMAFTEVRPAGAGLILHRDSAMHRGAVHPRRRRG